MRIIPSGKRDDWLAASDAALLRDSEIDTFRASGPGGQKRNKTDSAVRLRHKASGLDVIATESRSQHENKARALKRLRMAIALHVREPVGAGWVLPLAVAKCRTTAGRIELSSRNPDYALVVATTLDVIDSCRGALRNSAELLGITTGQLSKWISRDGKLLASVNAIRRREGLRTL